MKLYCILGITLVGTALFIIYAIGMIEDAMTDVPYKDNRHDRRA